MADKVIDGELCPFGKCVRDPHVCDGPCVRIKVGIAEICEALEEPGSAGSFSVLCSRRIWRADWEAALSLTVIRSRSGHRGKDSGSLESRLRKSGRTKLVSVSLHNEVHYQAHDAARRVLGWTESRVCAYESDALARAEAIGSRHGRIAGQRYIAKHWPFMRHFNESSVDYTARIDSLKWASTPDGPIFSDYFVRAPGVRIKRQLEQSVRNASKDVD